MKREKLNVVSKSMYNDILLKMSESNKAVYEIVKNTLMKYKLKGLVALINLDDMNIRGDQLYLVYLYCNRNLEDFVNCAFSASDLEDKREIVKFVNIMSAKKYMIERKTNENAVLPYKATICSSATLSNRPRIRLENIELLASECTDGYLANTKYISPSEK